jgi:hypothetical protein
MHLVCGNGGGRSEGRIPVPDDPWDLRLRRLAEEQTMATIRRGHGGRVRQRTPLHDPGARGCGSVEGKRISSRRK